MEAVKMDDVIEKIRDEIAETDIPERIMRLVKPFIKGIVMMRDISEAVIKLIEPLCDIAKEMAQVISEILAEEIMPKTVPPREPVRSIGGKPQTNGLALRMPYRARAGARHT
jgi:hypothetical protein